MQANADIRTIALGGPAWTKLADVPSVEQATVIADPKNAGTIFLRFRQGTPAEWPPGAAVPFASVDLSELEVQGNPSHALLIAGYAPGNDPRGRADRSLSTTALIPMQIGYAGGALEIGEEK